MIPSSLCNFQQFIKILQLEMLNIEAYCMPYQLKLQSVDDSSLNKGGGSDVVLPYNLLLDHGDRGARRLFHLGVLRHGGHQVVQLLPVLLQRVPSLHSSSTNLRQRDHID